VYFFLVERAMEKKFFTLSFNKSSVGLLIIALVVGGISASASEELNTPSGGYLVCIAPKTALVTYPATAKCPKGYKKLILGAAGATGAQGPAGASGSGTGNTGPKGDTGLTGLKGDNGPKGDMGLTGLKGDNGPKGDMGIGMKGDPGPVGAPERLTCAQGGTCSVDSTGPGGGTVFYVKDRTPNASWLYLEAAPYNWSGPADPIMKWCSEGNAFIKSLATGVSGAGNTGTVVGNGANNTKVMLGTCTFGAANMAASYTGGGKSDWFLPSKEELSLMYQSKRTIGGFLDKPYWSSSENGAFNAWTQAFDLGSLGAFFKVNGYYVRPIRAF